MDVRCECKLSRVFVEGGDREGTNVCETEEESVGF